MADILQEVERNSSQTKLEEFCILLWGIWRGRCDYIHNKTKQGKEHRISTDWCYSLLKDFRSAREQVKTNPSNFASALRGESQTREGSDIAVYVDAAYKEDKLEFGAGFAIFDPGGYKAAGGKRLNPPGSVLAAELEAIKMGIEYCFDNNITRFHVFTDSQDAIQAIKSSAEFFGIEEHTIDALRIMIRNTSVKGIWYTPRSDNKMTHKLAKFASRSPHSHAWVGGEIPPWITNIARDRID